MAFIRQHHAERLSGYSGNNANKVLHHLRQHQLQEKNYKKFPKLTTKVQYSPPPPPLPLQQLKPIPQRQHKPQLQQEYIDKNRLKRKAKKSAKLNSRKSSADHNDQGNIKDSSNKGCNNAITNLILKTCFQEMKSAQKAKTKTTAGKLIMETTTRYANGMKSRLSNTNKLFTTEQNTTAQQASETLENNNKKLFLLKKTTSLPYKTTAILVRRDDLDSKKTIIRTQEKNTNDVIKRPKNYQSSKIIRKSGINNDVKKITTTNLFKRIFQKSFMHTIKPSLPSSSSATVFSSSLPSFSFSSTFPSHLSTTSSSYFPLFPFSSPSSSSTITKPPQFSLSSSSLQSSSLPHHYSSRTRVKENVVVTRALIDQTNEHFSNHINNKNTDLTFIHNNFQTSHGQHSGKIEALNNELNNSFTFVYATSSYDTATSPRSSSTLMKPAKTISRKYTGKYWIDELIANEQRGESEGGIISSLKKHKGSEVPADIKVNGGEVTKNTAGASDASKRGKKDNEKGFLGKGSIKKHENREESRNKTNKEDKDKTYTKNNSKKLKKLKVVLRRNVRKDRSGVQEDEGIHSHTVEGGSKERGGHHHREEEDEEEEDILREVAHGLHYASIGLLGFLVLEVSG